MFANSILDEPQSYVEAIASTNCSEWQKAMKIEYDSLVHNKVWKLVDRLTNSNVIKCKWIYKAKHDASGNFDRFKARLVARGFSQLEGVDYSDTFSPVARHSTLRILFSLAVQHNMSIEHIDVTTAFLNANLNETIYMEQPPGFVTEENKVRMLLKSIYGLKQASRMWNLKVQELLTMNGYIQSKCEPCVYMKKNERDFTIIALYVDDFYVFTTCNSIELFNLLDKHFNVKHLGSLTSCLGMRITRTENVLILDQYEYVKRLLKRFNMLDCKYVSTPMIANFKLLTSDTEILDDNVYEYRQLVGCLNYLSLCTRPDITFSYSQLSQYLCNFNKSHWIAAKRVLSYLAGTINYGLCFYKSDKLNVRAYADADWGNSVDRKSYTGYIVKIGNNVVSWESRKQHCVALSSTESEYLSIASVSKELCFIKNFLSEMSFKPLLMEIYNDNQSAQKLLLAKEYSHKRTKHIDIKYHYVKDLVQKNVVSVRYLSTDKMPADVLTKPLGSTKHYHFVKDLNLVKM